MQFTKKESLFCFGASSYSVLLKDFYGILSLAMKSEAHDQLIVSWKQCVRVFSHKNSHSPLSYEYLYMYPYDKAVIMINMMYMYKI